MLQSEALSIDWGTAFEEELDWVLWPFRWGLDGCLEQVSGAGHIHELCVCTLSFVDICPTGTNVWSMNLNFSFTAAGL